MSRTVFRFHVDEEIARFSGSSNKSLTGVSIDVSKYDEEKARLSRDFVGCFD